MKNAVLMAPDVLNFTFIVFGIHRMENCYFLISSTCGSSGELHTWGL